MSISRAEVYSVSKVYTNQAWYSLVLSSSKSHGKVLGVGLQYPLNKEAWAGALRLLDVFSIKGADGSILIERGIIWSSLPAKAI